MALSNDDKVEIRELVSRYNKAIDTGDADGYANTFTEDGQFVGVVGTFTGRSELRAFAAAYATEPEFAGFFVAQHWVTNLVVEGDGDEATAFSHLMMVKPEPDGGGIILVGHYDDTLRRVDGSWRFTRRVVTAASGGCPAALTDRGPADPLRRRPAAPLTDRGRSAAEARSSLGR